MYKIPKSVMGLGGPITVRVKPKLRDKKIKVAGLWHNYKRLIEIESELPQRDQYHTYIHELVHAALDDSGQHQLLSIEGTEALCDLVATALVRAEEG